MLRVQRFQRRTANQTETLWKDGGTLNRRRPTVPRRRPYELARSLRAEDGWPTRSRAPVLGAGEAHGRGGSTNRAETHRRDGGRFPYGWTPAEWTMCACVCIYIYIYTYICVCVCVHPWTKGSFHHFRQAGGMAAVSLAMPTKLWDSAGRECGRTFLYLQRELLIKLSNSIGLFPWSFMFSPPNLAEFLCSLALQPTRSAPLVSADLRNNLC